MEDKRNIYPDVDFIRLIKQPGNNNFKQCMQCGTCSVVCHLATQDNPFPGKEMIWTAWGLKDKLEGNPNLWLCHQCGDCTQHCPRGVNPSDVLVSLRNFNYRKYAYPQFGYRLLNDWRFLPLVLLIPALIIFLILFFFGNTGIQSHSVDYSVFFPHKILNSFFGGLVLIEAVFITVSLSRFWKDMKQFSGTGKTTGYFKAFFKTIKESFTHSLFNSCSANKYRYYGHMMLLYSFVILLIVTLVAIVNVIFFEYPMELGHPAKIAGNFASLMLYTGILVIVFNRLMKRNKESKGNYSDWSFLVFLFLLTLSGSLTEFARFGNWNGAYTIYFIHLIFVWTVIIFIPYSKFSHFLYRIAAITFSKAHQK